MSLFEKFKNGLQKTAVALKRSVGGIFSDTKKWDDAAFAEMENALIAADLGVKGAKQIVATLREEYALGHLNGSDDIRTCTEAGIVKILSESGRKLNVNTAGGPTVLLVVGVNGSGKTTSIGKLACRLRDQGKKVMLAACDTFRAAAVEQLKLWGERSGAPVVATKQGADPAAVAFDAVKSAIAKDVDFLIIDTAGRQQNRKNLMDELAKLRRIIEKQLPGAPHETLMTVDASLGTNALSQAREFLAVCGASALILTKLDGTGKGGAACAVQQEFKLPVLYIGLGEAPDDLQEFSAEDYAKALLED
ncbi:MAG: signal recognition particle-docking protein FtsY [Lentisphaeria bacterium]|nr:signal recognition particle-docking protein FtsY [Lentisphaeria bacterium]